MILKEWDNSEYSGREMRGKIQYILDDTFIGIAKGYVAFSLKFEEGLSFENIDDAVKYWHHHEINQSLKNFLGLNDYEYEVFLQKGKCDFMKVRNKK